MKDVSPLTTRFSKCILTHPDSIFYFFNCSTPGNSFVCVVCVDGTFTCIVRDLEVGHYKQCRVDMKFVTYAENNPIDLLVYALGTYPHDECTVGIEIDSPRFLLSEAKQLFECLPFVKFVDISMTIKSIRIIKKEDEIDKMTIACTHVISALQHSKSKLYLGMTETEYAGILAFEKMKSGSEWTTYPDFVAFGMNGCIGHHTASPQKCLQPNEIIFVEVSATCDRYHASKMHTFYTGEPPFWFKCLESRIHEAMTQARHIAKPGVRCRDVDAAMRAIINAPFDNTTETMPTFCMMRRSGYTIGIGTCVDWTEGIVRLTPTSKDILQENMVLHLIPWIHVEGKGAMGFSDMVVVKPEGLQSLFDEQHTFVTSWPIA